MSRGAGCPLVQSPRTMYAYGVRYTYGVRASSATEYRGVPRRDAEEVDGSANRPEVRTPTPMEQSAAAAGGHRPSRQRRHRVTQYAQTQPRARRRDDVALQPLLQQRRPPGRHDRLRLQRDRTTRRRARLEDKHAAAGTLDPRGHDPTPMGHRPDGIAEDTRASHAATPRRRHRMPPGRRLLAPADRPRLLSPRQLHLRLRAAGTEPGLRHPRRDLRARKSFPAAVPHKGVPTPRRADDRARPPTRLRLRRRIRVRPGPRPRRPRKHLAHEIVLDRRHVRQADLGGGQFDYPPGAFGQGTLGGVHVPCLSRDQQLLFHTGYEPRTVDLLDLALLQRLTSSSAASDVEFPLTGELPPDPT